MDMPPVTRALYRNAQDRSRDLSRQIEDLEREPGQDAWRERRLRELHDLLAKDRATILQIETEWKS